METIKVNMTPNPLDVQTIHASQNDSEARQWGFELHNNGEKIDSSSISDQLVFKAYKGGTEQILPENGSTPTTSPFNGDIKYPQGLLTDQEFLYRESPTESDGLAKITDIKGNTLVWNQLCNNGNFDSNSGWNVGTVSNNELTFTITSDTAWGHLLQRNLSVSAKVGHKYLIAVDFNTSIANRIRVRYPFISTEASVPANTWYRFEKIGNVTTEGYYLSVQSDAINGDIVKYRNFICIDLTAMFGSTKADEIYAMEQAQSGSGIAYFRSLFPLPYYQYDSGSLLPFRGEGLKTVGKNLVNPNGFVQGLIDWQSGNVTANTSWITSPYINALDATSVTVQGWKDGAEENFMVRFSEYDSSYNVVQNTNNINISSVAHYQRKVTLNANTKYIRFSCGFNNKATTPQTFFAVNRIMMEFGGTASSYESYKEDTLSLPISTYFPSGMKSAGSVYDELTPTKAITRIGAVDLGTLYWRAYTDITTRKIYYAERIGMDSTSAQLTCAELTAVPWGSLPNMAEKTIQAHPSLSILYACDSSCEDATEFTSAMNGVYLYYELATPTEISFTTASLVTENAEIPLSNEDGVLIGKCTEQLSENPGFHDAKIKLRDGDGTCYSNKLQLHIERSPQ